MRSVLFFLGVFLSYAAVVVPALAASTYVDSNSLQGYIIRILHFINNILLPLIFSIALLFFLYNAFRYFILGGAHEGEREKARILALYGIGAFVFLVSIWGIVNMIVGGLSLTDDRAICPDYLTDWCFNSSYTGDSNSGAFFNFEINF
jgi:hypothetical protein